MSPPVKSFVGRALCELELHWPPSLAVQVSCWVDVWGLIGLGTRLIIILFTPFPKDALQMLVGQVFQGGFCGSHLPGQE